MANSVFLIPGIGAVIPGGGAGGGTSLIAPLTLNRDDSRQLNPPLDAILLTNDTPATAAIPLQQSPALRFRGHVWNTTAAGSDNAYDWFIYTYPTSSATPTSDLFIANLNGFLFKFTSYGSLFMQGAGQSLVLPTTGYFGFSGQSYFSSPSNGTMNLTNSAVTIGVGFDFTVDGKLKIRNKAHNADGNLSALNIEASGYVAAVGLFYPGNNKAAIGSPLDSQLRLTNNGNTTGIGLEFATDTLLAIRNIAHNADASIRAAFYNSSTISALTITANTIVPTSSIHQVGAGLIKTITVPATLTPTGKITILPTAAYTYDATGNILVPSGGGTAVINKAMDFYWNGTKWIPSY